jgi:hypothetical protein
MMRTDRNRNPAAFTTDLARQAGLALGVDYAIGDSFQVGNRTLYTARLLKDPVELSIAVIDKVGYYTLAGAPRWTYIQMPQFVWRMLDAKQKRRVIAEHYRHEGGTEMKGLFAADL